jgi:subtilisin family serine protease
MKAINWAITQGCNIITMSFGMEQSAQYHEGFQKFDKAIGNAHDAGILMFAAASNCGANGSRTYPAWDCRVVGVHALDGCGWPSRSLNPSTNGFPSDNFGTLGVAIKCSWQGKIVYKSGTSFATPIAAGIAALVLEYMDQSYALNRVDEASYKTFRQCDGMRQIFLKFMSKEMGNCGYRFVAPWIIWNPRLYTDEDIWSSLKVSYLPNG